MSEQALYRVIFVSQGNRYEIYARSVGSSGIFGFVEIADFSFDRGSTLVVDPSLEQLEKEYSRIKCTHIPLQHVLRIDEVSAQGEVRVTSVNDSDPSVNILPFPPFSE